MKPALIAVALLMATPTTAAEITRAGDVVTIKGMIWGQDAEKFASMTRGMPRVTVSLDSAGGVVDVAIEIARRVRGRGYGTAVHTGARCDSACPLIWFAGIQRYLGHEARLGFHSARQGDWPDRYEAGNAQMRAYLTELGDMPPELVALLLKANPDQLGYLDRKTAVVWALIKEDKQPWDPFGYLVGRRRVGPGAIIPNSALGGLFPDALAIPQPSPLTPAAPP
jgi:hypothetical protein